MNAPSTPLRNVFGMEEIVRDPAIEAAQRAYGAFIGEATERGFAISAAREALKPIQQLWRRELGANNGATFNERARKVFDGLAPLIFNDDEMEGGTGE